MGVRESLLSEFRVARNQMQGSNSKKDKEVRREKVSGEYEAFQYKYDNLEDYIDKFTLKDLAFYFKTKSHENGYRYIISNMKRDLGIFKRIKKNFSNTEICIMIEFIFESEQNYLDKHVTQPTVLSSNYVNTIFRDSQLWIEDKYTPYKNRNKIKPKREWVRTSKENTSKIGEWE